MIRIQKVSDVFLPDHHYLSVDDDCGFIREYTPGERFDYSDTNSHIANIKKKPSTRRAPGYKYKAKSINVLAAELGEALKDDWLRIGTIVPIPPSKAQNHPDYDDRLVRILRGMGKNFPVDIRELVVQKETIRASHESPDDRPTPDELYDNYEIDLSKKDPTPVEILVFDDVLTAGSHYRAVHRLLSETYPGVKISGCFIARCVRTSPVDDFHDDDLDLGNL